MFKRNAKKAQGLCTICLSTEGVAISHALGQGDFSLQACDFIDCTNPDEFKIIIEKYITEHSLMGIDVALVLRASEYRLFFLDAPNVPDEERAGAAKFLVKDLIDYPLDQAAIDVFDVPNRAGNAAKVYVVAMKLARLTFLSNLIADLGLNLLSVSISELAINALVSNVPEAEQGVAFLYKDSQNLHVLITKGGVLRIIRDVGPVSRIQSMDEIERLVLEIQRSIDFYQSQLGHSAPSKLFVTPRIGEHADAIAYLSSSLTLSVEPFVIEQVLPEFVDISDTAKARCLPVLGELVHLLKPIGEAKV